MHRLLLRQLKKARGGREGGAVDLDTLLTLVDGAYGEFERQHRVLGHTHNVMREEHGQLNARLSRLRDGISQMGAGFSIWDRLLIYGTGGVAFASFNSDLQLTGTDLVGLFAVSGVASATKTGWTAGGGLEWAINPNWSLRGEYRHSDFGSLAISPGVSSIGAVFAADRHLAQDQVQVGFSYKFGDWVAPVPVAAKY